MISHVNEGVARGRLHTHAQLCPPLEVVLERQRRLILSLQVSHQHLLKTTFDPQQSLLCVLLLCNGGCRICKVCNAGSMLWQVL